MLRYKKRRGRKISKIVILGCHRTKMTNGEKTLEKFSLEMKVICKYV